MNILPYLKAAFLYDWANTAIDRTGRNSGFNNQRGTLGTNIQDIFYCIYDKMAIQLLAEFIIRCRDRNDVYICMLVFGRKADTCFLRLTEQLVQPFLLKCRCPGL